MANTLRFGSKGPEVTRVQRALNQAGHSHLPPLREDGDFGQKTLARVREFQAANQLVADGIVGPKTQARLQIVAAPGSAAPPVVPAGAGPSPGSLAAALISATKQAHRTWKAAARFQNIRINGPSASGAPGCLLGPDLAPLILSQPPIPGLIGDSRALADAAAKGISANFRAWQNSVTVPGLPWYPNFAAVPGPLAPPQPNVPSSLAMCPSGGVSGIVSSGALQSAMSANVPPQVAARDPQKTYMAMFAEIAASVASYFANWLPHQMVVNVIGQGPVPTFAPPHVPVGPVVNGSTLPGGGHLP